MSKTDYYLPGSTIKAFVAPEAEGFDPERDEWQVDVVFGTTSRLYKTFHKQDMRRGDDGTYIYSIDTNGMSGVVYGIIRASIPDADCDGGIRKEVYMYEIAHVGL